MDRPAEFWGVMVTVTLSFFSISLACQAQFRSWSSKPQPETAHGGRINLSRGLRGWGQAAKYVGTGALVGGQPWSLAIFQLTLALFGSNFPLLHFNYRGFPDQSLETGARIRRESCESEISWTIMNPILIPWKYHILAYTRIVHHTV